jgi:hypothetical protein
MTDHTLTASELAALIERVFNPRPADRALAILVDLPDSALPDNPDWKRRRALATDWAGALAAAGNEHDLDVSLIAYRNVRANNADLPATAWRHTGGDLPADADALEDTTARPFAEILGSHQLVLAPTELSATAPLKVLARQIGFRAATMPGFSPAMVPALRLDYNEVNRRVNLLKDLLDRASGADLLFRIDGSRSIDLHLDLRHRTAHASGGVLHQPGTAGNLPSGEAYVVPYEGEIDGDPTTSAGELAVQHGDEVVIYTIRDNRAVAVTSDGAASRREAELLRREPARGNLAELGLGVLADFGITPIDEVLLDEKLGLHIAFGRSEHFGGQVGPDQFSCAEAVIHQDHVFIAAIQPRVLAERLDLTLDDGSHLPLLRNGSYVLDF